VVSGDGLDGRGSILDRGRDFSLHCILKVLDTFSLLSSGYRGIYRGVNQTEHETDNSSLMQTLRMHTSSWSDN
jgi:hypothetical protein